MNDNKKTKAKNTLLPVFLVAGGLGISIAFLYLFAQLAEEMLESEVESFDDRIIGFFNQFSNDVLDIIMFWITESGSIWFLTFFSFVILSFLWIKKKDKWGIIFFIITIGGGGLLTKMLKISFGRERPSINEAIDAVGYSFPSGHSMGSFLFYGFLAYLMLRSNLKKTIKWTAFYLCGLMTILIGTSRIYLGAHYPSDVIAGYLAGGFWLIICLLALEYVKWRSASQKKPIRAFKEFIGRQLDHKL